MWLSPYTSEKRFLNTQIKNSNSLRNSARSYQYSLLEYIYFIEKENLLDVPHPPPMCC